MANLSLFGYISIKKLTEDNKTALYYALENRNIGMMQDLQKRMKIPWSLIATEDCWPIRKKPKLGLVSRAFGHNQ